MRLWLVGFYVFRSFREQFLEGLVRWLGLDESVMPVMEAFLAGLGFEGSDTFLSILQAEPLLSTGAAPITQVTQPPKAQTGGRSHKWIPSLVLLLG